jgi:peroxiredoxin
MIELGQLEGHHADFEKRNVQVVAVSQDNLEDSKKTQAEVPHLKVVSDVDHKIADALGIMDKEHHSPKGEDTNAPTTILVDGSGTVRWIGRPNSFLVRFRTEDVLEAVDKHLGKDGQKVAANQ